MLQKGRATLDVATLNEIVQTQPASLRWCGQQRAFTVSARDVTRSFLDRLLALVPPTASIPGNSAAALADQPVP
jgi:hypothetical protein